MADRKQERERLREIRREAEAREAREQRRRLLLGYAVAGVLGAAVLVGIVIVIVSGGGGSGGVTEDSFINTDSGDTNGVPPDGRTGTPPPPVETTNLRQAARQAGCDLQLNLRDEGNTHIPVGSDAPEYQTNPPTSGDHVEAPFMQADGAYAEMPDTINFVHSLEHGRLEIQYSPDLPEADQLELKGLYDDALRRDAPVPQPADALRGRGHHLDEHDRLRHLPGRADAGRDPRLRPRHLGTLRQRAG